SHIFVLVVSTLDQYRSTLVPDSRKPSCQTGTVDTRSSFQQNSFTEMGQQVDTRSRQVDILRLKLKNVGEPIHFQKKPFGGQRGFSRSVSISRSCKPPFQVEGQGNQGESLERRLLCKAREQIQLKRLRRRRISGISDAIKAEHRQLRRISIDFHQASSIEVDIVFLMR
ncbi:hypothetical protein Taro_054948, partial [Colocasia esculenta]|nr:hypothetical protein [Colocasia esculenta]